MGPLFDNRAVVDDQNLVRTANCTQPMGDDKAGAPRHQAQHRLLNVLLGARIDTAGCLVQDQNAGVGEDRPGNRQQLTLALAQVAAPFGEQRGITVGQAVNKLLGIRQLCGLHHLGVAGIQATITNVRQHRVGKEIGILEDNTQLAAQFILLERAKVMAINIDRALVDIIKPGKQVDDCRLPGTSRANQRKGLPWFGV